MYTGILFSGDDVGIMVALGIGLNGNLENLQRAVFYADFTAFAAFQDDVHLAAGDLDFFYVERRSSEDFHVGRPSG